MQLFHGDCLEVIPKLTVSSVNLILTDPPYGTTQCKWDTIVPFDDMWTVFNLIRTATTPCVVFGSEPFSSHLRLSNLKEYKYDWIWDKIKGTGFLNAKKQPMRNHEIISVFYHKQCLYNPQKTTGHPKKTSLKRKHLQSDVYGEVFKDSFYSSTERYPRSILQISSDTQTSSLHPTQKPVALMEYLIKTYTNKGDTVIDPFMGSGTTGVACKKLGRNFIGIEKDEGYFNIAKNRIEEIA